MEVVKAPEVREQAQEAALEEEQVEKEQTLEALIAELSPELRRQVRDYVEFLMAKYVKPPRRKPTFDWAGCLSDLRDKYTSVELQHKIADMMIDDSVEL